MSTLDRAGTPQQRTARPLRFYGRRRGHALRPARRRLMATLLPEIRIDLPPDGGFLNIADLFDGARRDYWMEIGFGSGEHLAGLAERYPDVGFIGCEPFINGVAALVSVIDEKKQTNIRIFDDDVRLLFPHLPANSLQRIYLPYADPWPKKKHHRRRLVQADTIRTFAELLKDNGEFRFASDHMGYIQWVLELMNCRSDFEWTARRPRDWLVRPADSIETRYEAKARSKGSRCVYLRYRRIPRTGQGPVHRG